MRSFPRTAISALTTDDYLSPTLGEIFSETWQAANLASSLTNNIFGMDPVWQAIKEEYAAMYPDHAHAAMLVPLLSTAAQVLPGTMTKNDWIAFFREQGSDRIDQALREMPEYAQMVEAQAQRAMRYTDAGYDQGGLMNDVSVLGAETAAYLTEPGELLLSAIPVAKIRWAKRITDRKRELTRVGLNEVVGTDTFTQRRASFGNILKTGAKQGLRDAALITPATIGLYASDINYLNDLGLQEGAATDIATGRLLAIPFSGAIRGGASMILDALRPRRQWTNAFRLPDATLRQPDRPTGPQLPPTRPLGDNVSLPPPEPLTDRDIGEVFATASATGRALDDDARATLRDSPINRRTYFADGFATDKAPREIKDAITRRSILKATKLSSTEIQTIFEIADSIRVARGDNLGAIKYSGNKARKYFKNGRVAKSAPQDIKEAVVQYSVLRQQPFTAEQARYINITASQKGFVQKGGHFKEGKNGQFFLKEGAPSFVRELSVMTKANDRYDTPRPHTDNFKKARAEVILRMYNRKLDDLFEDAGDGNIRFKKWVDDGFREWFDRRYNTPDSQIFNPRLPDGYYLGRDPETGNDVVIDDMPPQEPKQAEVVGEAEEVSPDVPTPAEMAMQTPEETLMQAKIPDDVPKEFSADELAQTKQRLEQGLGVGEAMSVHAGLPPVRETRVSPDEVNISPEEYQHKLDASKSTGQNEKLQSVKKWDPLQASTLIFYRDKHGDLWVVDGHQRVGLAKRLSETEEGSNITLGGHELWESDGWTKSAARVYASFKNLNADDSSRGNLPMWEAAIYWRNVKEDKVAQDVHKVLINTAIDMYDRALSVGQDIARLESGAFKLAVYDERTNIDPRFVRAIMQETQKLPADMRDGKQQALIGYLIDNRPINLSDAVNRIRLSMDDIKKPESGALFDIAAGVSELVEASSALINSLARSFAGTKTMARAANKHGDSMTGAGVAEGVDIDRAGRLAQDSGIAEDEFRRLAGQKGTAHNALVRHFAQRVVDKEIKPADAVSEARKYWDGLSSDTREKLFLNTADLQVDANGKLYVRGLDAGDVADDLNGVTADKGEAKPKETDQSALNARYKELLAEHSSPHLDLDKKPLDEIPSINSWMEFMEFEKSRAKELGVGIKKYQESAERNAILSAIKEVIPPYDEELTAIARKQMDKIGVGQGSRVVREYYGWSVGAGQIKKVVYGTIKGNRVIFDEPAMLGNGGRATKSEHFNEKWRKADDVPTETPAPAREGVSLEEVKQSVGKSIDPTNPIPREILDKMTDDDVSNALNTFQSSIEARIGQRLTRDSVHFLNARAQLSDEMHRRKRAVRAKGKINRQSSGDLHPADVALAKVMSAATRLNIPLDIVERVFGGRGRYISATNRVELDRDATLPLFAHESVHYLYANGMINDVTYASMVRAGKRLMKRLGKSAQDRVMIETYDDLVKRRGYSLRDEEYASLFAEWWAGGEKNAKGRKKALRNEKLLSGEALTMWERAWEFLRASWDALRAVFGDDEGKARLFMRQWARGQLDTRAVARRIEDSLVAGERQARIHNLLFSIVAALSPMDDARAFFGGVGAKGAPTEKLADAKLTKKWEDIKHSWTKEKGSGLKYFMNWLMRDMSIDQSNAAADIADQKARTAVREKIWRDSGWVLGKDKKWRFEIPNDFKIKKTEFARGKDNKLGDVVSGSVFNFYPEAKDIKVKVVANTSKFIGRFFDDDNKIVINMANVKTNDELASVLAHELQHWIQNKEGFSLGGSNRRTTVGQFNQAAHRALREKTWRAWGENRKMTDEEEVALREVLAGGERDGGIRSQVYNAVFDEAYYRLHGEAEAREVESRLGKSAEWRAENLPDWDGIPMEDLILRMGSDRLAAMSLLHGAAREWKDPQAFWDFVTSGDGGQSFGVGLYLTEGRKVAKKYEAFNNRRGEGVMMEIGLKSDSKNMLIDDFDFLDWEKPVSSDLIDKVYERVMYAVGFNGAKNKSVRENMKAFIDDMADVYDDSLLVDNLQYMINNDSYDILLFKNIYKDMSNLMKFHKTKVGGGRSIDDNIEARIGDYQRGDVAMSLILRELGYDGWSFPSGTLSGIEGSNIKNYVIVNPKIIESAIPIDDRLAKFALDSITPEEARRLKKAELAKLKAAADRAKAAEVMAQERGLFAAHGALPEGVTPDGLRQLSMFGSDKGREIPDVEIATRGSVYIVKHRGETVAAAFDKRKAMKIAADYKSPLLTPKDDAAIWRYQDYALRGGDEGFEVVKGDEVVGRYATQDEAAAAMSEMAGIKKPQEPDLMRKCLLV